MMERTLQEVMDKILDADLNNDNYDDCLDHYDIYCLKETIEKQQKEIHMLDSAVEQDDETKTRYANEIGELISLVLWSARRLHKYYKGYVYDDLEKITGQKHERL